MPDISDELIKNFHSLFRGREDVFAIRWGKDGKSGYMPAYDLNWDEFSKHKARGGTLKDFQDKQFSRLTKKRIINHLTGKEVIGLYPLLTDNSSWFIVADFDESLSSKMNWMKECLLFMEACNRYQIPSYLERSRSGKGGHVWIFFDTNYPAIKSRKIMLYILEMSGIISPFDKNSNYDRLFPNQDYHSGKGLGNLIALPFQKKALENNNSCFINPETQLPFEDQLSLLQSIKKVSTEHLDGIFQTITATTQESKIISENILPGKNEIHVTLNNQVSIPRKQLTPDTISFLRDNLNFINSDYIIKKKLGKNTFGTEPYFKMLEEKDDLVLLPRGFIGKLLRFFNENKIIYHLVDERKKLTEINFNFKASLYERQQQAVDITDKKDMGVIVAPPGSGKTIVGLGIISHKKQPALIIVHRKQLFDQWIERIQSFLGIAEPFIGKIASGHQKIGTHITVAMIQSLAAIDSDNKVFNSFGLIIVDECHHVPAKTFREVISRFSSYYLFGLTATPIRKNNDERLIFIHIGDVIHQLESSVGKTSPSKKVSVIIRETNFMVPFDFKTDQPEILYQILIHDSERNRVIIDDIKTEVNAGRKVLVLTERKAHLEVLRQYLKNNYEVITISGEDAVSARGSKFQQIKDGHFQILISTGQFFGEGTDMDNLDCLTLAFPFAFEGKLIQYIGRVQRAEITPIIYDYRDKYVIYLEQQFRQRNRYYKKLWNTGQLQKFDELTLLFNEQTVGLNSEDFTLPISCLDLPVEVEKFKEDVVWKLRVLSYNEESAELITEITDYHGKPEVNSAVQSSLQFLIIDKIKFRTIETGKLLNAVALKKIPIIHEKLEPFITDEIPKYFEQPKITYNVEKILSKTMKVPFNKINFLNARVSFSLFIEEFDREIIFEIDNPDIRPEFEAVKDYFSKILKKKSIAVEIKIRYNSEELIAVSASCDDIDKINSGIIDSVRFEFVKKRILAFKGNSDNPSILNTLDSTLSEDKKATSQLFKTEQDLIDDILSVKNSKHYHQLKFLSSQHLSSVLKMRFIINPFSFLFLLGGEKRYHIIWETLNSEEATYLWHFEKSIDALRKGLIEIEEILKEIKVSNKQNYLSKEHNNFSRVIHDYYDSKSGFIFWKGMIEEKLI
ncbi:MAG: DEAD/DEAH box helicase family protein [Ginsengibacter sp.]